MQTKVNCQSSINIICWCYCLC